MAEPPPVPPEMLWYYLHGNQRLGPVTTATLVGPQCSLPPSTMVWREGMADWQPMSAVPELARAPQPNPISAALSSPGEVALGLTMPGLIIFIILLFMCLPLCWLPWVIDDLHVKKNA